MRSDFRSSLRLRERKKREREGDLERPASEAVLELGAMVAKETDGPLIVSAPEAGGKDGGEATQNEAAKEWAGWEKNRGDGAPSVKLP